jgi:hypothetical protein
MKSKFSTREQWLQAAIGLMGPVFKQSDYKVPKVRVSCGWPSRRATSANNMTIGQCWDKSAASDKVSQIFISPYLADSFTRQGVLPTLIHEVCHAVVGCKEGHNRVFGACARAVGLEGKLTSTHAGKQLMENCKKWTKRLGDYPHSRLNARKSPVKVQGTRLLKCECGKCGYVCRVTNKWIEQLGAPLCPCNKKAMRAA